MQKLALSVLLIVVSAGCAQKRGFVAVADDVGAITAGTITTSDITAGTITLEGRQSAEAQIVSNVRAKYGTPLGGRHGAFLIEVACATGRGLLRKDWGTFVRVPDGTGVAQDIVMDRDGTHYDILGDGEGAAIPGWGLVTEPPKVDPGRYYAPACTVPPTTPQPPIPPPPPAPPDLTNAEVLAVLREILEGLAMLETRIAAVDSRTTAIQAAVLEVQKRPFPDYTMRLLGQTVTLTPRR